MNGNAALFLGPASYNRNNSFSMPWMELIIESLKSAFLYALHNLNVVLASECLVCSSLAFSGLLGNGFKPPTD